MDQNSLHDYKLESQIRECFGKVAYTHKAHEKCADDLESKSKWIKIVQVVLSAITTGGFLYSIFGENMYISIFGTVASGIMLALTLYYKEFKMEELVEKHRQTALKLWDVRESFISLIADFDILDRKEITSKRDMLQKQLFDIYEQAPRTNEKGYVKAQKALKQDEELTFSDKEIDVMLPMELRKNNLDE